MQPNITLEPLGMEHATGYAALLSDTNAAPYISEQGLLTHEAALAKLQQIALRNTTGSGQVYFAIVDISTREFFGYIAAHDLLAEICPISYAVLPEHRRRGIARTAIRLLLDYLAQHSTAAWIEAKTHPENSASRAALQACGFQPFAPASSQTGQRDVFQRKR